MIGTRSGRATLLVALATSMMRPDVALAQDPPATQTDDDGTQAPLASFLRAAQAQLRQTFTNLQI
jgi:hypothetical protein